MKVFDDKIIVTTGRKAKEDAELLAAQVAEKLSLQFVERKDFSIDALKKIYGAKNILIAKKNSLNLLTKDGELFFHPNTAHLRIKNLRQGLGDRLIDAAKARLDSAAMRLLKVFQSAKVEKLLLWKKILCLLKLFGSA